MRGRIDLMKRFAFDAHRKCQLDDWNHIRIRDPAVQGALDAFPGDNGYGLALEAFRRCARHGAIVFYDVMQAAAGFPGYLFCFFLVGDIDEGFEDELEFAFGNVIDKGMNNDALFTKKGLVILRIYLAAGKAGKGPDEQPGGFFMVGTFDQFAELVTAVVTGATLMDIGEDLRQVEAVFKAVVGEDIALLFDGSILVGTAGIAQVGPDDGSGWEGGWWGDVFGHGLLIN